MIFEARYGDVFDGNISLERECDISHWREDVAKKHLQKDASKSFWNTLVTTLSRIKPISRYKLISRKGDFGAIISGNCYHAIK